MSIGEIAGEIVAAFKASDISPGIRQTTAETFLRLAASSHYGAHFHDNALNHNTRDLVRQLFDLVPLTANNVDYLCLCILRGAGDNGGDHDAQLRQLLNALQGQLA